MSSRRAALRTVRRTGPAVLLVACAVLTGCTGDNPEDSAAGFDDLQSAMLAISGQGIFIDPGTTAAAEGRWVGSGFLVSADGLAVTSSDVVAGADTVAVRVGAEESAPVTATLLGASECLDVAVIQLPELGEGGYPFLAWRDSEFAADLEVHSAGFAAEAPRPFSLTPGTVSNADLPLAASGASVARAIEHNALIVAGGAGGPLVDDEGHVVGVGSGGDDAAESDLAVHRDIGIEAFEQLSAGDPVLSIGINAKGWVSADGSNSGVWVQSVLPSGAAAAAGVLPGDLVVKLGGTRVGTDGTLADYCTAIGERRGEAPIDIEVYRTATDELLGGQIDGLPLQVTSTAVYNRSGAFTTVGDEGGIVRVDVPVEWAQVDGAGFADASGKRWYSVAAAPNLERYRDSLTEPGVQVAATGGGGSAGDLLTSLSGPFDASCSPIDQQPYDDGVYAGGYARWDCDGTLAMIVSTRNARGNNIAVIMQLRSPFDQQETLQKILSTFQVGR